MSDRSPNGVMDVGSPLTVAGAAPDSHRLPSWLRAPGEPDAQRTNDDATLGGSAPPVNMI